MDDFADFASPTVMMNAGDLLRAAGVAPEVQEAAPPPVSARRSRSPGRTSRGGHGAARGEPRRGFVESGDSSRDSTRGGAPRPPDSFKDVPAAEPEPFAAPPEEAALLAAAGEDGPWSAAAGTAEEDLESFGEGAPSPGALLEASPLEDALAEPLGGSGEDRFGDAEAPGAHVPADLPPAAAPAEYFGTRAIPVDEIEALAGMHRGGPRRRSLRSRACQDADAGLEGVAEPVSLAEARSSESGPVSLLGPDDESSPEPFGHCCRISTSSARHWKMRQWCTSTRDIGNPSFPCSPMAKCVGLLT